MNPDAASYFNAVLTTVDEQLQADPRQTPLIPRDLEASIDSQQTSTSCIVGRENLRSEIDASDEVLLDAVRGGNKESLTILFRRHARAVRAVAFRILRDQSEADDLLQEVFLFLFRKAGLFDATKGSARSWIIQATYHRAIDRRRHLSSRRFYAAVDLDDPAAAALGTEIAFYERSLEGTLGNSMVQEIEESLSSDQRETLRLYFFEGYTIEEIAEKMVQTPGNIRNHYYRALEKMRKLIFSPKLPPK